MILGVRRKNDSTSNCTFFRKFADICLKSAVNGSYITRGASTRLWHVSTVFLSVGCLFLA